MYVMNIQRLTGTGPFYNVVSCTRLVTYCALYTFNRLLARKLIAT